MGKYVRRRLTNEHETDHNYTDDYDFVKHEHDIISDSFDMGRVISSVRGIFLHWIYEILASTISH